MVELSTIFQQELKLILKKFSIELDRRRPGQSSIVTQRKESDTVQFLSGTFEGKSTGTPIGFVIYNENQKSKDYEHIAAAYRPSHADFTYDQKFGIRDYRGGGKSSARETINWVAGRSFGETYFTLNYRNSCLCFFGGRYFLHETLSGFRFF